MKYLLSVFLLFNFCSQAQITIPYFENDTTFSYAYPIASKRIHLKSPNFRKTLLQIRVWQKYIPDTYLPETIFILDIHKNNTWKLRQYVTGFRSRSESVRYYTILRKTEKADSILLKEIFDSLQEIYFTEKSDSLQKFATHSFIVEILTETTKCSFYHYCFSKNRSYSGDLKQSLPLQKAIHLILAIFGDTKTKICFVPLPDEFQRSYTY
jgi:hypothetical protein